MRTLFPNSHGNGNCLGSSREWWTRISSTSCWFSFSYLLISVFRWSSTLTKDALKHYDNRITHSRMKTELAAPPSSSVGGEGAQALSFWKLQIFTLFVTVLTSPVSAIDGSKMRFELQMSRNEKVGESELDWKLCFFLNKDSILLKIPQNSNFWLQTQFLRDINFLNTFFLRKGQRHARNFGFRREWVHFSRRRKETNWWVFCKECVDCEDDCSEAKFFKNAQICVETFETAQRAPLGESPEESAFTPLELEASLREKERKNGFLRKN